MRWDTKEKNGHECDWQRIECGWMVMFTTLEHLEAAALHTWNCQDFGGSAKCLGRKPLKSNRLCDQLRYP